MAEPRKDDDPIEALESLASAANPQPPKRPRPAGAPGGSHPNPDKPNLTLRPGPAPVPKPAGARNPDPYAVLPVNKPAAPPRAGAAQPKPAPTLKPVAPPPSELAPGEAPPFRCLHCGYPIADTDELRCMECGRTFERETLEAWSSGEEKQRFEHVLWLVLASLFLKLLLLEPLLVLGRVADAFVVAWACWVAVRNKPEGPGRFFGVGGIVTGGLMLVGFAWPKNALPFYILDIIAGCLLLMSLLSDPSVGRVASVTIGRQAAPLLLFAAPVFGFILWSVKQTVAPATTPGIVVFPGTPTSFLDRFPPFDFLIPYLTAAVVWIFVWRSLAGVRKMLFAQPEAADESR